VIPAVPVPPPVDTAPFALYLALDSPWPWLWILLLVGVGLFLWSRKQLERAHEASPPPAVTPPVPRVTFMPRLDAGRQVVTVVDDGRPRSFDLALHVSPGIQSLQFDDRARAARARGGTS
jgi:hypothetical protein